MDAVMNTVRQTRFFPNNVKCSDASLMIILHGRYVLLYFWECKRVKTCDPEMNFHGVRHFQEN
jgi:hypothetical protein